MFTGREEGGEIGVDGSDLADDVRGGEYRDELAVHEDFDRTRGFGSCGGRIKIELANQGLQDVDGGLRGIPNAVAIFIFEKEESALGESGFERGRGAALLFCGGESIEG